MATIKFICSLLGIVLGATYSDCDPILTQQVKRNDQIMAFYVFNISKKIPGLSGLFIAGVLTASLRLVHIEHLNL